MNAHLHLRWPAGASVGCARSADRCQHEADSDTGADGQFITMLNTFRRSGGLARAEEALTMFERTGPGVARLARWIVERQVVSFEWQSDTWLPLFQFNRPDLSIRAGLVRILAELNDVYDPWEMAHWFARPNSSLDHASPADVLRVDSDASLAAIVQTARTDRFAAMG